MPAVLALATVAMLSGVRSLYAITQWGCEQPAAVVRTLGATRQQTPDTATLHRDFKALDVEVLEAVLRHFAWSPGAAWGHLRLWSP